MIRIRVYKSESHYVAECVELPVVTQGRTLDETVENIREALLLHPDGERVARVQVLINLELNGRLESQTNP